MCHVPRLQAEQRVTARPTAAEPQPADEVRNPDGADLDAQRDARAENQRLKQELKVAQPQLQDAAAAVTDWDGSALTCRGLAAADFSKLKPSTLARSSRSSGSTALPRSAAAPAES